MDSSAYRPSAGPAPRREAMRGLFARLRPDPSDDGLSLIELMVSLVVFSLAATGIAAGFISAIKTSGNDRNRVAAANLAQREVDIVRNTFASTVDGPAAVIAAGSATNPNPLPGGAAGEPLAVDGREYTVERSVGWLTAEPGASSCDGGSATLFPRLAIGVTVSWNGMTKPVQTNTILTPPRHILNSNTSFVAVKVTNAAGGPNQGRRVVLTSSTGVSSSANTQADGCAVFATTQTGTHTITIDDTGYVGIDGIQAVSKSTGVTASSFKREDFSYDAEATLRTRLATDAGHTVPAGVTTVTLYSTGFTDSTKQFPASGASTTIGDLWPISSGYSVWAGSCTQSDPGTNGGTRPAPVLIPAGSTSALTDARLTPVTVDVRTGDGTPEAALEMVAVPKNTAGCTSAEQWLVLGSTDAAGVLKTSLPGGEWTIRANDPEWVRTWPTTTLLRPDSPAQTIEVSTG